MKDYHRITMDEFSDAVWKEILEHYPEYHYWIDGNRYLPEWMMWELAKSEEKEVKQTIAWRYDAPQDLLALLSNDKSPDIRFAVGMNLSCPKEILEKLALDKSPTAREGVASNMRCPKDLLRKLSKDKGQYVREEAIRRLEVMREKGVPKIPKYWDAVPQYEGSRSVS